MRARGVAVPEPGRRPLLVSKGWVQAVALVVLFGFFVLGFLTFRTYQAKPPIPQRVVDPGGQVLYTADDIAKGQQVFLHNGLMEYGSVFGHGAYLGPDFTADYLRRSSDFVLRAYGGAESDSAARRTARGLPDQPLRRGIGHAAADGAAGRGAPAARRALLALLLRADDQARAAPEGDHGPDRAGAAHRLLRLDGVVRVREPARATTTPTRTTGRPSRACRTSRPRTWSSGRCSR